MKLSRLKHIIKEQIRQLTEDRKITCYECRPTGRRGKGQCHHVASILTNKRPTDCMSWDACLLECEGITIDYDRVNATPPTGGQQAQPDRVKGPDSNRGI